MDFGGLPNTLSQNNSDGTFDNVTEATGVGDAVRKSMNAIFCDLNRDRRPDIFVTKMIPVLMVFTLTEGTVPLNLSLVLVASEQPSGVWEFLLAISDGQFDIVYTNYAAEVNVIAQLVDKTAN